MINDMLHRQKDIYHQDLTKANLEIESKKTLIEDMSRQIWLLELKIEHDVQI